MEVKMGDGVAGIVAHVEHQPVPAFQTFGLGSRGRQLEHVHQGLRMLGPQVGRIVDMPTGNN